MARKLKTFLILSVSILVIGVGFTNCVVYSNIESKNRQIYNDGSMHLNSEAALLSLSLTGYVAIDGLDVTLKCITEDSVSDAFDTDQVQNQVYKLSLESNNSTLSELFSACKIFEDINDSYFTFVLENGDNYLPILTKTNMDCIVPKVLNNISTLDATEECLQSDNRNGANSAYGAHKSIKEVNKLKVYFPENLILENMRTFKMGFTPWPYAVTLEAFNNTYTFIDQNADLIAHHLDFGIPWPEATTADNFDNYGSDVKANINGRVSKGTELSNKTVYLGVSPFSSKRDGLAPYWSNAAGEPLPVDWASLDIGNDYVIAAYINFLDEVIQKLNPTYVNYAIEINEFDYHVQSERLNLIKFVSFVYTALKDKYPDVKFMVSFTLRSPDSNEMTRAQDLFNDISPYMDMVGISVYPYAFFSHANSGDPANLPSDWLSQIKTIAPNKPYFIAETGFIAERMVVPSFGLNVDGSSSDQAQFVDDLFSEANKLNAEGVVWYTPVDFDGMWDDVLQFLDDPDANLIWRDTGLKDGDLNPRPALTRWGEWLQRPVK